MRRIAVSARKRPIDAGTNLPDLPYDGLKRRQFVMAVKHLFRKESVFVISVIINVVFLILRPASSDYLCSVKIGTVVKRIKLYNELIANVI